MAAAANLTDWRSMPPSFDVIFGSHIHLGEITSFEDKADGTRNPPQVVIGNSGTQFVAAVDGPPKDIFGLLVKQSEVMYQYGYLVMTQKTEGKGGKASFKGKGGKAATPKNWWLMEFKVCTFTMPF
jgi:hypothetical protein